MHALSKLSRTLTFLNGDQFLQLPFAVSKSKIYINYKYRIDTIMIKLRFDSNMLLLKGLRRAMFY